MNIPADAELITGMRIISTVPLAKPAEMVKAVAKPAPRAEVVKASALPGVDLAKEVAKARQESGEYGAMYSFLQDKLATLRQKEKGGMDGAVRVPPSGRARGGADAIDGVLTFLRPLVDGTAKAGHADTMRKEIGRLRDAARTKASAGDSVAMGAFDQYSDILKQL